MNAVALALWVVTAIGGFAMAGVWLTNHGAAQHREGISRISPTRLASLGQTVVVRQAEGERKAAMFDLGAIRKGEAPDPEILPGDTIIVGLSRAKAILGGALLALPAVGAGFVALDGGL